MEITEGIAPFNVLGVSTPCKTWYKVVRDFESETIPLIILHSGPKACHNYLLPLIDFAPSMPLVFNNQIGNSRSIHLS
ncbi:hypothetical protein F5Y16DRAFT_391470 [Xylariaceae sp. FL0255]|nr:hypothetical protein F5Y16DRAFT_391470 [Xylariaceae sp. FL0255]